MKRNIAKIFILLNFLPVTVFGMNGLFEAPYAEKRFKRMTEELVVEFEDRFRFAAEEVYDYDIDESGEFYNSGLTHKEGNAFGKILFQSSKTNSEIRCVHQEIFVGYEISGFQANTSGRFHTYFCILLNEQEEY